MIIDDTLLQTVLGVFYCKQHATRSSKEDFFSTKFLSKLEKSFILFLYQFVRYEF